MTKDAIKQSLLRVIGDRSFVALLVGMLVACLIYCLVVGLTIQPRDVQVYTHYTGFGQAHFYKNLWQYTLLFVFFGVLVTFVHGILMIKLHGLQRRQTALILGWLAILILLIAGIYSFSILRLAFR